MNGCCDDCLHDPCKCDEIEADKEQASSGNSDLLSCPFCGHEGIEAQKGTNYVIVRCKNLACGVRPSAVCYEKSGAYNFWPWNNRAA